MFDLFKTVAFAEAAGGAAGQPTPQDGGMFSIISLVIMLVVFYFVLVRPQKKQEKKHREMIASLKVGDKVISAGGIAGKIVKIKDDFVYLETGFVGNPNQQATIKLERAAIKILETVHEN